MGFLGNLLGKKQEQKETEEQKPNSESEISQGRYSEQCALCEKPGTEKKWMGKYWHVKCVRRARKAAKGMI
ncbi:MAG TPA: hypothetical protein VJG83_05265 [archaeon]|nr:hypothetical protein [archaeon]